MVLVTGSGGKTGKAITRALKQRGFALRLFRRAGKQQDPLFDAEVHYGDLEQSSHLIEACRGVRAVYHIGPNMHPREDQIGIDMVNAAVKHRVEHVVMHSVLFPQIEAMPHHWRKLTVEQALIQSGLSFTILQPAAYYQNFGKTWREILRKGEYIVPYPVEARLSLVDLDDVAQVASKVMLDPEHYQAIYPLVGEEGPNQREIAEQMSQVTAKAIRARQQSLQEWAEDASVSGMPPEKIEDFLAMFRYYGEHDFIGNRHILEILLDRPPTSLDTYLARLMDEHHVSTSETKQDAADNRGES